MNAVRLLKKDHRELESWFREFELAGDRAHSQKQWVAEQVFHELEIHTELEDQIFYPAVQEGPDEKGTELVRAAIEAHAAAKRLMDEMKLMSADDELYDAKFIALQKNVQHHIEEEEGEMLPRAERALDDADLEALGRRMTERRQARTSPIVTKATDIDSKAQRGLTEISRPMPRYAKSQRATPKPRAARRVANETVSHD